MAADRRPQLEPASPEAGLVLRVLVDTYERVQKIRIECGERIRAVSQGRAKGVAASTGSAAVLLDRIRRGETDGPIAALGRTYRTHVAEERNLRRAMSDALEDHPAWPWLQEVRGVGPTLAAKLLGRLDIRRAPTPSSFWSYCGLATVPGSLYRCVVCGSQKAFARGVRVSGRHTPSGAGPGNCGGRLEPVPEAADVRVAPLRPAAGQRFAFDPVARRTCFQLGVSLLRAGGRYAEVYRSERERLERSGRGWTPGHIHMAALRNSEKRFLAHLWIAWAESEGLRVSSPYPIARLHRNGSTSRGMEDRRRASSRPAAIESKKPE